MKIKIKNLIRAVLDQGPLTRFIRNFFITGNAWGLFHINSHISQSSGKPKVEYSTPESAAKAMAAMSRKTGGDFSAYKCAYCDGYHIGKNRSGD